MTIPAMIAMEVLCLGFLHYFPWQRAFRTKDPHPPVSILTQILAFNLILTWWLLDQGFSAVALVLWYGLGAIAGALAIIRFIDAHIEVSLRADEAEQREQLLRSQHAKE